MLANNSQQNKKMHWVFIPRMSPCRHSALKLSTHHTLCMFQSSQNSQAWKTPSDCVSCSATAKLGRQTLTTGNLNFQRQQVEKSLFAVFATQNGAKCDLFVEKMRATKVNMHQCLFLGFFLHLLEQKLNVLLDWFTADFVGKNFWPFSTWISQSCSFPLRIQCATLDLCLGFLACPGWTTLCKGRHLLHPLKRSGGG